VINRTKSLWKGSWR